MFITLPDTFGERLRRKWSDMNPAEREARLLAIMDADENEIRRAIDRADRARLEEIEWSLRDGSPYDSEAVERRVDQLLALIGEGLEEIGRQETNRAEWR